jgi:hypothetical protein
MIKQGDIEVRTLKAFQDEGGGARQRNRVFKVDAKTARKWICRKFAVIIDPRYLRNVEDVKKKLFPAGEGGRYVPIPR